MNFSNVPKELSHLNVFLRCASDHSAKDPTITYYCLLHAFQKGLSMIQKSPPIKAFLTTLMDKLEELKRSNSNCEEIANETVGIPYVEQYALKLFDAAYQRDINSDFGPATVKLFLSAATLLDVVSGVGEVGDDIEKTRKYAKWKAVYISKCLKSGEVPVGGPIANTEAAYTPNISGLTNTNNLCNNETNQQPHEVPTTCIPKQPPSPDPSASDNNITTRNWLNVEKDIKCALSASNYQDRETTVKYLKQALKSLGVDI
ncbi:Vacuolar protein sorting-associated protein vta1, variant 3 [Schistosoma haematobium]|uniref:Vacuolar protein sorting-associated protein vta1, variant 3 n=1 Tax=Schistosoma haematobium TaxID=6185 RepID=A0A6A5DJG8_SCHHA|nr:Vacuolar protein sorting-associated protein vta1, variant 3 [Schistosoma haematobium]CAH8632391.1 unnamed protein product [Schistosoma intercalatum]KAH9591163.1 Vacuolar protein sorting-associated protein vta1, variant 3 [Schistosoma haematobium]CAH8633184.1 unnamed protein product [Schistosoma intercalatum]CAH8666536.1 unnamed protein product [Schistosoma haematobium]CAH8673273.1 unnamed protein product [Schistosoma haematobium]